MTRLGICGLCITFLFCAAAVIAAPAQNVVFTRLLSFDGTNGDLPRAGLVQASDGNLYGTTSYGGHNNGGTVFKITPAGALTTLYGFCSQPNCADGADPEFTPLVEASDGNFYGATVGGGANGGGTIFEITRGGTLTTLYSFCAQATCTDGSSPQGDLVLGMEGNFYGTTAGGGDYGCGTVFRVTPGGMLTTLHSFDNLDGQAPNGLVQANDGNFYGVTAGGGGNGYGTVFKITPGGTLATLHSFDYLDGFFPNAGLVQASDGNLYGSTNYGGGSNNCVLSCGTVFRITPDGTLTTLHSFDGSDGSYPVDGLVQLGDGSFYGTTYRGGSDGLGTIFKMTPSGMLTTLHHFDGNRDGAGPAGRLLQATNRLLYGTTAEGGAYEHGTVFRLAIVRTCSACRP